MQAVAMDRASVSPQICVLKMKVKCEGCQKKVKKQLQKVHGVHSINIDADGGKVTISSTVDPRMLIEEFAKIGKKAKLVWEQKPSVNYQNNANDRAKNVQAAPCDAQRYGVDQYQLTQLQELAKNRRLKHLEINQTKNIKMTFNDNGDLSLVDHTTKKTTADNLHEPRVLNIGATDGHNPPPVNTGGHQGQYGYSDGASSSRGPAPFGNGDGECSSSTKNESACNHDFELNCGGYRWCEEKAKRPLLPPSYAPRPGPPQPYNHVPHGAPPPSYYSHHGLPPERTSYAEVDCGEESKTCMVM